MSLAGVAFLCVRAGRRERWGILAVGMLFGTVLLPLDYVFLRPLENRFPAFRSATGGVDGILVLGGAVDPLLTADHGMPALTDAGERMTTFVALARHYPGARLVFSGGLSARRPGRTTESSSARQLFNDLGLDDSRVVYEDRSRNTFENAVFTYRVAAPRPTETWLLVTSASHMPRAMGVFRKVGWDMVPVPVGYKVTATPDYSFDVVKTLQALDLAMHEWAGLTVYYLTGRSNELFPGPGR